MDEDPLISREVQPAQTIAEMTRASYRLREMFPVITLPVLILHGSADKIAKPSGSEHFYNRAGSADKTLKIYDGHVHDLLNDTGKEVVFQDINAWIARQVSQTEHATVGGQP